MSDMTRRDFLKLTRSVLLWASGILGAAGLARYLNYQPDPPPPTRYEVGTVDSFPLDSQNVIADIPALLIHKREGFQALSMRCTHLGCTLERQNSMVLACPCHGSQFDILSGGVIKGPAVDALTYLQIEVTPEGMVVIYDTPAMPTAG